MLKLFIRVEFSPDIVITNKRKPDRIENTLATKFNASVLFVKVCVRKIENNTEAKMFNKVNNIPE
ncbi:hypothetical protein ECZU15_29190 [Escherichia coli]|nr:hypothetical protein ECZU15_29190 [Escherichia coli]